MALSMHARVVASVGCAEAIRLSIKKRNTNIRGAHQRAKMSALFNFQSLLLVILLAICTATYVRATFPGVIDRNKEGVFGIFFKLARIGERLSPYVSLACIIMAVYNFV